VSRLTDLIARAKAKDPTLGEELDREFRALASRRAFGVHGGEKVGHWSGGVMLLRAG
jgi:hypothetical protein